MPGKACLAAPKSGGADPHINVIFYRYAMFATGQTGLGGLGRPSTLGQTVQMWGYELGSLVKGNGQTRRTGMTSKWPTILCRRFTIP